MVREYEEAKISKVETFGKMGSIITVKHKASVFPGQYFMVWIPGSGEIALPISSSSGSEVEFLITKEVGITRKTLWVMEKSFILLRGPYGHGFPMNNLKKKNLVLIGEPSLLSPLLSVLNHAKDKEEYGSSRMIINEEDKSIIEQIKKLAEKQKIQVLLQESLSDEKRVGEEEIYLLSLAQKNLKKTLSPLKKKGISPKNIYYYIPRKIRCGDGTCGTCAAYGIHTCIDGPVIRADLIEELWK